jgi:hypothetical protein
MLAAGRRSPVTELERLAAVEEIRHLKARYFRGVDCGDPELVRGLLAEDCELDYVGCFVDPATGRDFLPVFSRVIHGRADWPSASLADAGIVSVHQGHNVEIDITGDVTARAVWSMTDRLFLPPGGPVSRVTGYGHYHETYEKADDVWRIKTLRLTRIRVEAD